MDLWEKIESFCKDNNLKYYGVSDLSTVTDYINDNCPSYICAYPKAISIGIKIPDMLLENLKDPSAKINYFNTLLTVNQELSNISIKISQIIEDENYEASPVLASVTTSNETLGSLFSHKLAAHLAGLGWIGKSCLLINPEVGPRIRWVTILTDAPLDATGEAMDNHCGNCTKCIDICPVHAFTEVDTDDLSNRDIRFDAHKCYDYLNSDDKAPTCGLCVKICPQGNRKK